MSIQLYRFLGPIALLTIVSCGNVPSYSPGDLAPGQLRDTGEGERPAWVDGGDAAQLDPRRFLSAVGAVTREKSFSDAREAADHKARAQLTLSLRARVESDIQSGSLVIESLENGRASSSTKVELRDITRVVGESTLEGVKIAARWRDERTDTFYSLAAMDRSIAARGVAAELARLRQSATAELQRGQSLARAGGQSRTLGPYLRAYDHSLRAHLAEGTYRAIAGRDPEPWANDRASEIYRLLARTLDNLELAVLEGQDQRGSAGAGLPEEIVLGLTLRDAGNRQPVEGVELVLEPEFPDRVALSATHLNTDRGGRARVRVDLLQPTGQRGNSIRCALAAAELSSLEAAEATIRYSLETLETLDVLVVLEETSLGGGPLASEVVAPQLREALREAGIPVVSTSSIPAFDAHRVLQGTKRELAEWLGERVDVVLRGRAGSTPAAAPFAGHRGARSTIELEALDLVSGRTLLSFEDALVDSHPRDQARAASRSLRSLARRGASERVVAELRAHVEGERRE